MLTAACTFLFGASALGSILALYHLGAKRSPHWLAGGIHAVAAASGFILLILALRGASRGAQYGTSQFGEFAAFLAGIALAIGIAYAMAQLLSRRPAGWILGVHATLGAAACILLLAYVSLG